MCRSDTILPNLGNVGNVAKNMHQRKIRINGKSMLISGGAAGGYEKWCPTAAGLCCSRLEYRQSI